MGIVAFDLSGVACSSENLALLWQRMILKGSKCINFSFLSLKRRQENLTEIEKRVKIRCEDGFVCQPWGITEP